MEKGFYFDSKEWLGNSRLISMDWDAKAMHVHLMALACQQDKRGYLIKDEKLLRKVLGNPELVDWNSRLKEQIYSMWKEELINNVEYIYQPCLLVDFKAEEKVVKKIIKPKKSKKLVIESDNQGFSLSSLLKVNPSLTILYEPATKDEKSSIWNLGLSLVKKQGQSDIQARGFLAKLIKQYGDKSVANAIAQLSIKEISPVEVQSYLIGILKKSKEQQQIQTGRGFVSL